MIHKYKLNGFPICLDVNSGAVHVVDDCSFDLLDHVNEDFFPPEFDRGDASLFIRPL